jgi:4,5-DOPA dioxygenase extradiol
LVSAHWETTDLRVTGATDPGTPHDFQDFPPALYQTRYPAPDQPELAAKIVGQLKAAGLNAQIDPGRLFDHGAWVTLSLLYPEAKIPVVQLSLPSKQGPAMQIRIGQALAGLREQDVLLIGSGSITHNLGELDWQAGPEAVTPWAKAFRNWIVERLERGDTAALHDYLQQAPHARRNHPSAEHLLPLFFARAAGQHFNIVHQGFALGALSMDIYRFD